jgi:hypothetical protein
MDKEIILLKYLDNELPLKEKEEVELLLKSDTDAVALLEKVRSKRESIMKAMDKLNPQEDIVPPESVISGQEYFNHQGLGTKVLRWAAILTIPLAVFFIFRETVGPPGIDTNVAEQTSEFSEHSLLPEENFIDYAVSPNRIWSKKEMIEPVDNH